MTMPQDVIGVDVAKSWIDVGRLSTGQTDRHATTKQALVWFAKAARGCLVVFEGEMGSANDPVDRLPIERAATSGRSWRR